MLVIDVGGSTTYPLRWPRELDPPDVIGTERGTTLVRAGDRIRVAGEMNLVRVLA